MWEKKLDLCHTREYAMSSTRARILISEMDCVIVCVVAEVTWVLYSSGRYLQSQDTEGVSLKDIWNPAFVDPGTAPFCPPNP